MDPMMMPDPMAVGGGPAPMPQPSMGAPMPQDSMMAAGDPLAEAAGAVQPPSEQDMIMEALMAVLGKWDSQEGTLGMERGALLDVLGQIMMAQPPPPVDAMSAGGAPDAFGMAPPMGPDPSLGAAGPSGMPY